LANLLVVFKAILDDTTLNWGCSFLVLCSSLRYCLTLECNT